MNNTTQINALKSQNVRIEQRLKSQAVPAKDKGEIFRTKQKANIYKHNVLEKKAAELQKENELLKRQVPNAGK